ncbi:MAG: NAD(P)/FAD-dependent oxidoreductase, partial [Rhodospirillales bacterium]|nr:NAD(P)/FAD-dependent oxidoreductase [Rhodospirillales bacterium]
VTGVRLADGREITARAVAAGINPRLLFTRLVAADAQPEPFLRRMAQWKCKSGTFRMNVALRELPDFTCAPGTTQQPHHTSGIIMAPSLRYMDRACRDAREYGWSKSPIVEMLIPSTLDETLAPAGQHVASLFCQHFDYDLPDGQNWDDAKDAAAETVIDTVSRFAPNFRDAILGTQVLSPLDLERDFGLIGGDIFHGQLDLGQLYSLRPAAGHADYRMPVKGLYLCASGAHPGGGVTGAPGHNAAREMIRDLKGRRI